MINETLHVLVVEDDEVDIEYIRRSLQGYKQLKIVTVNNAQIAMDILCGQNGQQRLPRPYLILLDLGLPGVSGLEFLRQLRSDPALRQSVVFVVNGAGSPREITAAYDLNIAGYFLKEQILEDNKWLQQLLNAYQNLAVFPESS